MEKEQIEAEPTHAKPAFYAFCYESMKDIARSYGYNLVLHGSMNRDLDLIAIPWHHSCSEDGLNAMINTCCKLIGAKVMNFQEHVDAPVMQYKMAAHGRRQYVLNIYRGGYNEDSADGSVNYKKDPQFYIDLSVMPIIPIINP